MSTTDEAFKAEVERLRAELEEAVRLRSGNEFLSRELGRNNARLVTANALLKRCSHYVRGETITQAVLLTEVEAHLAGQPAETAETEHTPGCRYVREYPAIDPEDCPRCAVEQTAVPAQVNYSLAGLRRIYLTPQGELSPAEQRVLDAVEVAVDRWQEGGEFAHVDVCAAELARREGKL